MAGIWSIDDLGLSVRATNCLKAAAIFWVDDLVQKSERDLLGLCAFGETCLSQVNAALAALGLRLSPEENTAWPSRDAMPDPPAKRGYRRNVPIVRCETCGTPFKAYNKYNANRFCRQRCRPDVRPALFILQAGRLWADGLTAREIGGRLGVTKNVIIGIAARNSFPKRPSPIKRGQQGETPCT